MSAQVTEQGDAGSDEPGATQGRGLAKIPPGTHRAAPRHQLRLWLLPHFFPDVQYLVFNPSCHLPGP